MTDIGKRADGESPGDNLVPEEFDGAPLTADRLNRLSHLPNHNKAL